MSEMELRFGLPDADATREFGRALASVLRAGDLIVLTGDLGAGKTTLTQGIGQGLDIRGRVASPTFVIAREHPPLGDGPALVHVDAYRLGSLDDVDALDLDASLAESVTVVEWGEGLVDSLARDRLEITLVRPRGTSARYANEEADDGGSESAAKDVAPERDATVSERDPADPEVDPAAGARSVLVRMVGDRWVGVHLPVPA